MTKRTQSLPSTQAPRVMSQAVPSVRPKGTLTLLEAAKCLGLTTAGMHAHIRRGDLKAQKLRGEAGRWHWYINEHDLEALAAHLRQVHGIKSAAEQAKEAEYDRLWRHFVANQARYRDLINAALATLGHQESSKTLTRMERAERVVLALEEAAKQFDPNAQPLGKRKRTQLAKEILALNEGFEVSQYLLSQG